MLSLYLTLAPYGGNLEGIRAASLAYFGKEPKKLSLAEAALLVALPQSPELRRPDRSVHAARAARDRVLDRIAKAGRIPADEVALAKLDAVASGRRPMPALAPHAADQAIAARAEAQGPSPDHRRGLAEKSRGPGARAGEGARTESLGRDPRRGQRHRRSAGARRLVGLFRRGPRRAGRHDRRAALARLGAEAVHLRPRLRGWHRASGDADRGPAGALRRLRAGEFRSHVPGHGDGAPRLAIVAQRAGGRAARRRRREPVERANLPGRRHAGAAEGRSAGARHGARRPRHQAVRSDDALRRPCARRQRRAAHRAHHR